jgi:hypothetical protein
MVEIIVDADVSDDDDDGGSCEFSGANFSSDFVPNMRMRVLIFLMSDFENFNEFIFLNENRTQGDFLSLVIQIRLQNYSTINH